MKAYIVNHKYAEDGENGGSICVIADTPSEAKGLAFKEDILSDSNYIDLRVFVAEKGNIKGLKKGILKDENDGLKRGLFSALYNSDCPKCGASDTILYYKNGFYCTECEE